MRQKKSQVEDMQQKTHSLQTQLSQSSQALAQKELEKEDIFKKVKQERKKIEEKDKENADLRVQIQQEQDTNTQRNDEISRLKEMIEKEKEKTQIAANKERNNEELIKELSIIAQREKEREKKEQSEILKNRMDVVQEDLLNKILKDELVIKLQTANISYEQIQDVI